MFSVDLSIKLVQTYYEMSSPSIKTNEKAKLFYAKYKDVLLETHCIEKKTVDKVMKLKLVDAKNMVLKKLQLGKSGQSWNEKMFDHLFTIMHPFTFNTEHIQSSKNLFNLVEHFEKTMTIEMFQEKGKALKESILFLLNEVIA